MAWSKTKNKTPDENGWYIAKNGAKQINKYRYADGVWYGGTKGVTPVLNIIEWKEERVE